MCHALAAVISPLLQFGRTLADLDHGSRWLVAIASGAEVPQIRFSDTFDLALLSAALAVIRCWPLLCKLVGQTAAIEN